jgi:hypothetical protein
MGVSEQIEGWGWIPHPRGWSGNVPLDLEAIHLVYLYLSPSPDPQQRMHDMMMRIISNPTIPAAIPMAIFALLLMNFVTVSIIVSAHPLGLNDPLAGPVSA